VDDFTKWAFGVDVGKVVAHHTLIDAWNKLHRKDFEIKSDALVPSLIKMLELYIRKTGETK
jgi:hypothetical protein